MKRKIIITFLLVSALVFKMSAQDHEINWVTIEEAIALQKKKPRKIIMDVYTNWCGPCKLLDKNTFHNKDVVKYINENYYAVKFNAEGNNTIIFKGKTFSNPNYNALRANTRNSSHEFTRYLRVNTYPTMLFFDENANLITPISGYLRPQQLELYLKLFKSNKYKEMTTQEKFKTYYEAFIPTFTSN